MKNSAAVYQIYLAIEHNSEQSFRVNPAASVDEIAKALKHDIAKCSYSSFIKLYNVAGQLVPIGPNIPANDSKSRYRLVVMEEKPIQPTTDAPPKPVLDPMETKITAIKNKISVSLF